MNPDQIRIVGGILTSVVLHEAVLNQINKRRCNRNAERVRSLEKENELLRDGLNAVSDQNEYLVKKLMEEGIPPNEFDLIALTYFAS